MFRWLKKLFEKKPKEEQKPIPWDEKDIYGIRFRPIPLQEKRGRTK